MEGSYQLLVHQRNINHATARLECLQSMNNTIFKRNCRLSNKNSVCVCVERTTRIHGACYSHGSILCSKTACSFINERGVRQRIVHT